ncbi:hypothetical protein PUN28_007110 [Cardiocondyla obscurior]|uniref:Uncharacterized protein n=1 Tax=Cardiocondyla obscurior TaxID=286306 RepID=A0AAW2G1P7_9HYME
MLSIRAVPYRTLLCHLVCRLRIFSNNIFSYRHAETFLNDYITVVISPIIILNSRRLLDSLLFPVKSDSHVEFSERIITSGSVSLDGFVEDRRAKSRVGIFRRTFSKFMLLCILTRSVEERNNDILSRCSNNVYLSIALPLVIQNS